MKLPRFDLLTGSKTLTVLRAIVYNRIPQDNEERIEMMVDEIKQDMRAAYEMGYTIGKYHDRD